MFLGCSNYIIDSVIPFITRYLKVTKHLFFSFIFCFYITNTTLYESTTYLFSLLKVRYSILKTDILLDFNSSVLSLVVFKKKKKLNFPNFFK